jgi:hypothetical protein
MSQPANDMPALPPAGTLYQMIAGHYLSRSVYLAAELGLADLLHAGIRTADELATATATDAMSLARLLRLLVSAGLFTESDGGYRLSEIGDYLRSDTPGSMRAVAQLLAGPAAHRAWTEIGASIRTGEPMLGQPFYRYLDAHPYEAEAFNRAMISLTGHLAPALIDGYRFRPDSTIVDVGGGHGELLLRILLADPTISGVLFDQPAVVADARERFTTAGLGDRSRVEAGSFFDEVPSGGDYYTLRGVLHNWDDGPAAKILERCRDAMGTSSTVLAIETVVPDSVDQSWASRAIAGVDVNQLVMLGGRERTENQFRKLFDAAGLQIRTVHSIGVSPSGIPRVHHVVEGVRAL